MMHLVEFSSMNLAKHVEIFWAPLLLCFINSNFNCVIHQLIFKTQIRCFCSYTENFYWLHKGTSSSTRVIGTGCISILVKLKNVIKPVNKKTNRNLILFVGYFHVYNRCYQVFVYLSFQKFKPWYLKGNHFYLETKNLLMFPKTLISVRVSFFPNGGLVMSTLSLSHNQTCSKAASPIRCLLKILLLFTYVLLSSKSLPFLSPISTITGTWHNFMVALTSAEFWTLCNNLEAFMILKRKDF